MEKRTVSDLVWPHIQSDVARVEIFRAGARVSFTPSRIPDEDDERTIPARGTIKDMSGKSRRRAAFAFGNAECTWLAMSLLTFAPEALINSSTAKAALKNLRRLWRSKWGESMDGWIVEVTKNGRPHFHLFHCAESMFGAQVAADVRRLGPEHRTRRGKAKRIVRGFSDAWLVDAWLEASGQSDDGFFRGGIVELLDSADAAGRYVAKECAKREQKELPENLAEGIGRWWWLSPAWEPQPLAEGDLDIAGAWPWDAAVRHVWKASDISCGLIRMNLTGRALDNAEAVAACAETWEQSTAKTGREREAARVPRPPLRWQGLDAFPCSCGSWSHWDVDLGAWLCRCHTITLAPR